MHNFVAVYRMYKDGSNELLAYVQYPSHAETFCKIMANADAFECYIIMVNTADGKMKVFQSYAKPAADDEEPAV